MARRARAAWSLPPGFRLKATSSALQGAAPLRKDRFRNHRRANGWIGFPRSCSQFKDIHHLLGMVRRRSLSEHEAARVLDAYVRWMVVGVDEIPAERYSAPA